MKTNTKVQNVTTILSWVSILLKNLNAEKLVNLINQKDKFLKEILDLFSRCSKTIKESISLQCLRDNAKSWGWGQEQQDRVGINIRTVSSAKSVWDGPDDQFTDTDPSKFGEACITPESPPYNFEDIDKYKVLTEKDLFPNIDFTKESNRLNAIRKFVKEVDKLNQECIKQNSKPKYYIPGFDYRDFTHKHEDKMPVFMKDGNYYYYPASSFRARDGRLDVPCSHWDGSSLDRNGDWVSHGWDSSRRFLVLEDISSSFNP